MGRTQPIGPEASRVQCIRMDRTVREAVRILSRPGVDALVVVDGRAEDGALIGILTERDVFRAMATGGLEVLDGLVWMLAKADFVSVEADLSPADRLARFCAHETDHVAVMDGFSLRDVQSIWDCAREVSPSPLSGAV